MSALSGAAATPQGDGSPGAPSIRPYLIGAALALLTTVAAFGLVVSRMFEARTTLYLIGTLAAVQMLVHLRYFLHVSVHRTRFEVRLAIALAAVLIVLMVGGTLLVMGDLAHRMMPAAVRAH